MEIIMPVYSYICQECGEIFEMHLSFKDADKTVTCPYGHTQVIKKLSRPAVVFKGKGFYVTDHRPNSPSNNDRSGLG